MKQPLIPPAFDLLFQTTALAQFDAKEAAAKLFSFRVSIES